MEQADKPSPSVDSLGDGRDLARISVAADHFGGVGGGKKVKEEVSVFRTHPRAS